MNILYDVGSRDEDPGMTGLAHLFEHLMFGGSVNIPGAVDSVCSRLFNLSNT
ncbi:MAG: insulinase family protein [Marinilabiliales bacterium]|nr:insulinase family protein [Marinilabiliales bacterium]